MQPFRAKAGTAMAGAPEPDPAYVSWAVSAARLLLALVDLWLDKFDSIGHPGARKLSALALCVLLTAPLPALLERLELIVTHITSVWFEVHSLANSSTPAGQPVCLPGLSHAHGLTAPCHPPARYLSGLAC